MTGLRIFVESVISSWVTFSSIDAKRIVNFNNNSNKTSLLSVRLPASCSVLSYATTTNIKISDEKENLVNMLTEENLKEDINYLTSNNVDFIIAYLNIPNENCLITSGDQKKYVEMLNLRKYVSKILVCT